MVPIGSTPIGIFSIWAFQNPVGHDSNWKKKDQLVFHQLGIPIGEIKSVMVPVGKSPLGSIEPIGVFSNWAFQNTTRSGNSYQLQNTMGPNGYF